MKLLITFLITFSSSISLACSPVIPDPAINLDWLALEKYNQAELVIKGKVIKKITSSSLFNQRLGNDYLLIENLETFKGNSKTKIKLKVKYAFCGRGPLDLNEQRLFYLMKQKNGNYISTSISEPLLENEIRLFRNINSGKTDPKLVKRLK